MKLIIGLGNPGKKYENTRHNAGFILIDEIQKAFSFPEFKFDKKFNAEISEGLMGKKGEMGGMGGTKEMEVEMGEVGGIEVMGEMEVMEEMGVMGEKKSGEKTILIKPQTFMNLSGQSVQAVMAFYKIPIENLIVVHDDLDIELGTFKISTDSSAGGHNGVASIFETLGTQKIKRIRIGIEGSEKKKDRIVPGDVFVLQPFSADEAETIKKLFEEVAKNL